MARERAPGATFYSDREQLPERTYAIAILANVLHHVPPAERAELVTFVASRLRPGGALVLWEHNPMNPLTRKAVRDCPFDEDAILLWPSELRSLLATAGTHNVRRDWVVFFPAALSKLRFLERSLRLCPLGAQCVVTGEKS
jgi:SAM-dependent methyltransferase